MDILDYEIWLIVNCLFYLFFYIFVFIKFLLIFLWLMDYILWYYFDRKMNCFLLEFKENGKWIFLFCIEYYLYLYVVDDLNKVKLYGLKFKLCVGIKR